jgi:DNA-binding phage protein
MIKKYRTINEIEEEYLRDHPDEIDDYITILFDEYAESGDTSFLLSSLTMVSRVKGIEIPVPNSKEVVKTFAENSTNSTPELSDLSTILHAMGYRLMAQKLPSATI